MFKNLTIKTKFIILGFAGLLIIFLFIYKVYTDENKNVSQLDKEKACISYARPFF